MNINKAIQSALEHYKKHNSLEAENICKKILIKQPNNFLILNLLGTISYQQKQYDRATEFFKRALRFAPGNADILYNLANVLRDKREFDEAIQYYKKSIQLKPSQFESYHGLGMIFHKIDQLDDAIQCYRKALQMNPYSVDTYYNLGGVYQDKDQTDEAIGCYEKALQLEPTFSDAYYNLATILQSKKRLDDALIMYEKALQLNPNLVDAYYNAGTILEEKNQLDQAVRFYQTALKLDPKLADAYNSMGNILVKQFKFDKAVQSYHTALSIRPDLLIAYVNLANTLKNQGKPDEAERFYKTALNMKPDCSFCYSGLLFLMLYNSRYDTQTVFSAHRNFAKMCAEHLSNALLPHKNRKVFDRRLKIGYVSPDFRKHSVAHFIEPVIASHDRREFEVFCYADVLFPDEVTNRIQGTSDQWRNIVGISDAKAAELIRSDEIDILVDLSGHTDKNRLLLFARKPAPLQMSWIGYPATTGLSAIDYKIVDYYTDPPGLTDQFYTERLVRLPESFLCYQPEKDSPEIGQLPALQRGFIAFGSFNNFAKVTREVINLWIKILKAIPHAHLIMKSGSFGDDTTRRYVLDMFKEEGIAEDIIELLPFKQSTRAHLDIYNRIDIGLDTFPYNGTTTTCEAMWMGVPVITLKGNTHASRVGGSLLSNIGLTEFIADTEDEYVKLAVELSADINRLQSLRGNLRTLMMKSPLFDANRFTMNLENCYRDIWGNWCRKDIL